MDENMRDKYLRVEIKKETLKKIGDTAKDAGTKMGGTISGIGGELQNRVANAVDPYESNLPIVDQCVVPTENEIPVRQYNIAKLKTPIFKKAEGRLQVTNKRVLFRATGKALSGPIDYENEFSIEEIGGIEIKSDFVFRFWIFILNILLTSCISGIAGAAMISIFGRNKIGYMVMMIVFLIALGLIYFNFRVMHLLKANVWLLATISFALYMNVSGQIMNIMYGDGKLLVILALILIIASVIEIILSGWVEDLLISVKIKGAHAAIEIGRKLAKDERSGFMMVKPWKDTELAIRELGACIDDIRRFGDVGISKWKVEEY